MIDINNILITATVILLFITLLLAIFLVTVKTKHRISNYLFATYLILTLIDNSGTILSLISSGPSNFGMFKNTLAFLQIPMIYLYVLSVCYSDFQLKPKLLVHLLPLLVVNLVLLPRFYGVPLASKISFLENRQSMVELQFNHLFFHVMMVIYLIAIFIILRKSKKLYLENHSGTSINSYNWLFQFTVVLAFLYSIMLIKNIFKFSDYPHVSEFIKSGGLIFQLFIVCWYLFKALNHPNLFRTIDSKLKLVSEVVLEEKQDENSQSNESIKNYDQDLIFLKEYMEKNKPYLNPSLTIQNISDELNVPVRDLSLLINHRLGQHFFDFINTYRIENAMKILSDSSKSKVTILEILYEVGFNSKSSFNSAFKKHTGLTPTDYRKKL
jgi:AraC-like DNA-binding protein